MSGETPRPLTAVELFAGAGGTARGLTDAGFNVVAAIESDPVAAKTMRLNHDQTVIVEEDVRCVSPAELRKRLGLAAGDLDLLAACPPCQGFSTLGSGDPTDDRNDLVGEIWRFAREFRPAAVLVENVPGLARDARSARLYRQLRAIGYGVSSWIVDARDFGVPQRRRRLLAVAVRGIPRAHLPTDLVNALPTDFATEVVSADVAMVAAGPVDLGADSLHRSRPLSELALRRVRYLSPGQGHRDLPEHLKLECHKRLNDAGKGGATSPYGRMKLGEPSPTMTTRCTTISCGRFVHPTEDRAITLREAALLQTFPGDYSFAGTHSAIERQIGNALPVRLAHAAGLIIKEIISNSTSPAIPRPR